LAVAIREIFPWPQHPELAKSYSILALLYNAMRQFDQAEIFHLKAIKIKESILPKGHTDLGYTYAALADSYTEMKNYKAAIRIQESIYALNN